MLSDTLVLDWRNIVTLWLLKPFLVNQNNRNWFLFCPLSFLFAPPSLLSSLLPVFPLLPSNLSSYFPPPPLSPPSLQVAGIMDQFERQFEHLDVQTQTMEEAMSGVTTLTVPEVSG